MNDALRLCGFAVLAAMAALSLRAANRQAGGALALAAGLMLFLFAVSHLTAAVSALEALSDRAGVGADTVRLLIKLIGMAYVTEFAVQTCRDAGEDGLAVKTALCGKMLLMLQTLPLILEVGDLALSLSP